MVPTGTGIVLNPRSYGGNELPENILEYWKRGQPDALVHLYELAPVLLHSIDQDGVQLKVSRFWASKLGYAPEE